MDATGNASMLANAQALVADADRVVKINDAIFGTTGGNANVIVFALGGMTDGTGGADHMACTFQDGGNIEVDESVGNNMRVSALFEAEYSECAMNGQLCGLSTGEALSRWCAGAASNDALADFATCPTWIADGMQNFIDHTDQTDTNPDSIGCGMAMISYLIHRGATLDQIAPAMVKLGDSGTFAQLYQALNMGPSTTAWPTLQSAIKALPNVTTDDPFGVAGFAMTHGHPHI
jgi:hypothetical protein